MALPIPEHEGRGGADSAPHHDSPIGTGHGTSSTWRVKPESSAHASTPRPKTSMPSAAHHHTGKHAVNTPHGTEPDRGASNDANDINDANPMPLRGHGKHTTRRGESPVPASRRQPSPVPVPPPSTNVDGAPQANAAAPPAPMPANAHGGGGANPFGSHAHHAAPAASSGGSGSPSPTAAPSGSATSHGGRSAGRGSSPAPAASATSSGHGSTPHAAESPSNPSSGHGGGRPSAAPGKHVNNPLNNAAKSLSNGMNRLGKNVAARGLNKVSSAAKRVSQMSKQVALKVKNAGIAVWNFISSPVGWISIVLVVCLMLTSTIMQTYGNGGIVCNNKDGGDDSSSSTGSGGSPSMSGGVNWNADAQTVAKTFQKAGYSKAATAAALGNFMQESGVSAAAYNGSSGATGLGQWLGGRLTNMKSHATSIGKDWHSMDAQADYAVNVEVPPPGGWGTGLASWIKSKYPDQTMSAEGLWRTWASAGSDDASLNKAVFMWMAGYERPGQSESNLENREGKAKAYLAQLNTMDGSWAADGSVPAGKSSSGSSDDSNSSSSSDQAQCLLKDNDVTTSSTTGSFPTNTNNFGWMCNEAKVCKSGDWGPLGAISGASNPGGYQCVWYAWTRLWMIHGKNASALAPYSGNGGDIWEALQGKPGWQVDQSPRAGDGLSGHNFGGSVGSAGHVAVVEKVDADPSGWKITISEGNFSNDGGWNGYHGGRTFTKAGLAGTDVHFFRNTAWSAAK